MFKTGNPLADWLLLANVLLPLTPAILLFLRKSYSREPLNILLIVCLVNFLMALLDTTPVFLSENQGVTHNVLSLLELIGLFQLFKMSWREKTKEILDLLGVALLSATLTWLFIKGWNAGPLGLTIMEACAVTGIILISLPSFVRAGNLYALQSSLFWIAGGTLFYMLIFLLLQLAGPVLSPKSGSAAGLGLPVGLGASAGLSASPAGGSPPDLEKISVLAIAGVIRYVFYVLAVLVYRVPENDGKERYTRI